ncbi:unnamed protein product, partial [Chrysoparadoxa australica]
ASLSRGEAAFLEKQDLNEGAGIRSQARLPNLESQKANGHLTNDTNVYRVDMSSAGSPRGEAEPVPLSASATPKIEALPDIQHTTVLMDEVPL